MQVAIHLQICQLIQALFCYVYIDEDHNLCDEFIEAPVSKNQLLTFPNEIFKKYGVSHPFGEKFYGLLDYIPSRYDRKTILDALDKIPQKMCEDYLFHGTPDEIIGKIEEYAKIGLKHIVLYNTTYLADSSKIKSSFKCMQKVLSYFKK
ncbi:Phthiodiolone/phenolphthiodiolone dimycocerosates ketoreductase [subsurface metagenome]